MKTLNVLVKTLNVLVIWLSSFTIGSFLADGITGDEPIWIAGNCVLIGINYALYRSN